MIKSSNSSLILPFPNIGVSSSNIERNTTPHRMCSK
jgi:hypothetical protein